MTWRKLYLYLLVTGTLVLLGAWITSLRYETVGGNRWVGFGSLRGTLEVNAAVLREGPAHIAYGVDPLKDFHHVRIVPAPLTRCLGDWSYKRTEEKLEYFSVPAGGAGVNGVVLWHRHTLRVPFWIVWLVFNGCAFAFCRWMARRSGSGKEKQMADSHAGE